MVDAKSICVPASVDFVMSNIVKTSLVSYEEKGSLSTLIAVPALSSDHKIFLLTL
jgi:hypothetical protein